MEDTNYIAARVEVLVKESRTSTIHQIKTQAIIYGIDLYSIFPFKDFDHFV